MIALSGRLLEVSIAAPLSRRVWRIAAEAASPTGSQATAFLSENGADPDFPCDLVLVRSAAPRYVGSRPHLRLPPTLDHLSDGDVVAVAADGSRVRVLWRRASNYNALLLTERCDNHCLMCSQPPKERDDGWLLDDAAEVIRLLPPDTAGVGITGGEPTVYGDGFLDLLRLINVRLPLAETHILSNGRRFADRRFTQAYAAAAGPRVMVGIPLYGAEDSLHDYVVQAPGAFQETVRGILALASLGQRVEIRIVLQRSTAPVIVELADFIARNLPFVEQVALMGLEMTGLARANRAAVWIDPADYRKELAEAARLLQSARVRTRIYNHQLCLLPRDVWPLAVRSISDWKNEFTDECGRCVERERCGGFFSTSSIVSSHIAAITEPARALPV